jgi:hypothetical protein
MSLDPVFVNPLAAAYQVIGDYNEAERLINDIYHAEQPRT